MRHTPRYILQWVINIHKHMQAHKITREQQAKLET